jgi:hypothetical protein
MATDVTQIWPDGQHGPAWIDGEELVLDGMRERDYEVVALAKEAENVEIAVHDCLALGARALRAVRTTTDVAVVDKAFTGMTRTFSQGIEKATEEINAKISALLDGDHGAVPRWFTVYKAQFTGLLESTFDPDSKKSALAKLDEVMRDAARDQTRALRDLIDPENQQSPLGRYRSDITKTVEREGEAVRKAVEELRTQLAVDKAKADVIELTAVKGFSFEDKLERALVSVTSPHEDIAERVAARQGNRGKAGDFTVIINPADVGGKDARYVIEAKDSAHRLGDILTELDRAIANRDGLAAIAVFARSSQCPGGEPFQIYGSKALVVYDKDDPNDLALRLACTWARWVVRRQLATGTDPVDVTRIGDLIDAARQALRTASTIELALKVSKTKIDQALSHVATLVADLDSTMSALEDEISP